MRLDFDADDPVVLRQLLDWLRRDPRLRGAMDARLVPAPQTGSTLGGWDTLQATFTDPKVVIAAIGVVSTWLATRTRRTRIRISDGTREVEIETGSRRKAEEFSTRILRELAASDRPQPAAPSAPTDSPDQTT